MFHWTYLPVIFDCVKALPPKNKSPKIVFTLLSQSLKRTEGIKCKQISQQRVDMQMRNVTNFPEHVHRSFPQGEEYFANTVSQPRDPSHWIRRWGWGLPRRHPTPSTAHFVKDSSNPPGSNHQISSGERRKPKLRELKLCWSAAITLCKWKAIKYK